MNIYFSVVIESYCEKLQVRKIETSIFVFALKVYIVAYISYKSFYEIPVITSVFCCKTTPIIIFESYGWLKIVCMYIILARWLL